MNILSVMASGNGAFIAHKMLESAIAGYHVRAYNPTWTLFPPSLYLFRDRNADLLHTSPDYAPFFHVKGMPMVVTFHGYNLDRELSAYNSFFQNLHYRTDLKWFSSKSLQLASQVTCVSHYIAGLLRKDMGFKQDVRVIYNGVDEYLFCPEKRVNSQYFDVLFSGNLTRKKGGNLLPEIAKRLDPGIRILYTSGLRVKDRAFDNDRLVSLGRIPYKQMPAVYQGVDALLFPSMREGFGLAIAEAMSCGLPIVASHNSAIPELVQHGKGGFLCKTGDASAFAEAINHLASNRNLCIEMGELNRGKVEEKFTLDRMVREYESLFEQVILGS